MKIIHYMYAYVYTYVCIYKLIFILIYKYDRPVHVGQTVTAASGVRTFVHT
jgi:hypothetical protein